MPKPKVFISYRRADSAPYAGRVSDQLTPHFDVFMDVDTIKAGDRFRDAIERSVTSCDALIAVIGPRWIDAEEAGKRRLDDENDLVRLEIATALRRGIRVVPALVGGARMPTAAQLPPDLRALEERNALELSERHFREDMQRLIGALRTDVATTQTTATPGLAGFRQRARALSWWVKAPVLALGGVAVFALFRPAAARYAADYGLALARTTISRGERVPLPSSTVTRANDLVAHLARLGAPERSLSDSEKGITPWSVAQVHLPLIGLESSLKPERIVAYLRRNIDTACSCWRESPPTGSASPKRMVFVSGWIFLLFSQLGVPATDREVAFLLNTQRSDGSWPAFLVDPQSPFASTYATAWSVLGLHSQLKRWPNRPDSEAIASSVQRGVSWLLTRRGAPPGRWYNYPFHSQRQLSVSISGLVLHTLHAASGARLAAIDKEWLDNLPDVMPADRDEKQYLDTPTLNEGLANDFYVQIVLPWTLAATADAYQNGSPFQRARALVFLQRALTQQSVQAADTLPSWWRAELLIGMRHALGQM